MEKQTLVILTMMIYSYGSWKKRVEHCTRSNLLMCQTESLASYQTFTTSLLEAVTGARVVVVTLQDGASLTRVDGMMMDGMMMMMDGEDGMKERMNLFAFSGDFDVGRRGDRGGGEEDRLLGEVETTREDNEPTTTIDRC